MTDTFYVAYDNGIGEMGYMLKCPHCNRKMIVDCLLNGSNHNISVSVTCAECLVLSEEWKEKNPKQTKQIESFTNESPL